MTETIFCRPCGLYHLPPEHTLAPTGITGNTPPRCATPARGSAMFSLIPRKALALPLIRHTLTGVGGWLTGSGIATSQEAAAIVGGLVALASVLWGLAEKRHDLDEIANGKH